MSEQTITTEETTQEVLQPSLADVVWGDVPSTTATVETTTDVVAATKEVKTNVKDEVVDANEYLKQNLGYQDWEEAKKDIEELRKLKEQPKQEFIKGEDFWKEKEQEIFDKLNKRAELRKLESLDITNANDAAYVIKSNLRAKYPELDERDISDMFDENYSRLPKPIQKVDQTDEEFEAEVKLWESREDAINRKIVRDAKIAKPELIKLQNQIELPDIPTKNAVQELSQEDLQKLDDTKSAFIKSAESFIKQFNGFSAVIKDKDVEIPISYDLSKEEKAEIESSLNVFVEKGLDANAVFAKRWLNEDGTLNAESVIKDMALLLSGEKISQKYVNDAANKRLEAYLKDKKNISVSGSSSPVQNNFGATQESQMKEMQDFFWNQR
jgi:hypothetical protein